MAFQVSLLYSELTGFLMRTKTALIGALATAVSTVAGLAVAADLPPSAPQQVPPEIPGILSDVRFGLNAHDPFSPGRGSVGIAGEVLFTKFFKTENPALDVFIPRLHVGGSLSTSGKTSYGYVGLTWDYNLSKAIFIEASFGGAFHNGETGDIAKKYENSLGCSPLFREAGAIGYRLNENWSIMVTVEHMSNAGLCDQNRGLTNVGAKIGYSF